MFFPDEKNHLLKSIASITAMRTDNVIVDDRIIPVGWLEENGVNVRIERELSPFNYDGSLAKAGECFLYAIYFTSDYGLDERRIFHLPGSSRGVWSQSSVDSEIIYILDKNQRLADEKTRQDQKLAEEQRLHDERMCKRDQLIGLFFEQHGKPASSYRIGQIVATRDGSLWKIASKIHNDVGLIPYGGDSLKVRVVPNDELLVPASKKYRDKFRYELSGISY